MNKNNTLSVKWLLVTFKGLFQVSSEKLPSTAVGNKYRNSHSQTFCREWETLEHSNLIGISSTSPSFSAQETPQKSVLCVLRLLVLCFMGFLSVCMLTSVSCAFSWGVFVFWLFVQFQCDNFSFILSYFISIYYYFLEDWLFSNEWWKGRGFGWKGSREELGEDRKGKLLSVFIMWEKYKFMNNFILIDKPRKYDFSKFQNKCNAKYNHTYDKFTFLKFVF